MTTPAASRPPAAGSAGLPARRRAHPALARLVVAVMRRVPALFVLSLLTLGTVWLAAGRATAGPALIAAAAGAATVGVRIMLATRIEARSRLSTQRTELAPRTQERFQRGHW